MSLCTGVPRIKNLNLPTCSNCVHFIKHDTGSAYNVELHGTFGKCKLFGRKDIITGVIDYDYASMCRSDNTQCGENGKEYKEIPMV